jgi:tRNA A37 threonylcarbamoyladenosine biosynthesis protein TsaE
MDNDGKIREDYFEGSKIFGIEWSKQINSSPNSNSEIQSALSEASSLLTQFDEVNSENKLDFNADANL